MTQNLFTYKTNKGYIRKSHVINYYYDIYFVFLHVVDPVVYSQLYRQLYSLTEPRLEFSSGEQHEMCLQFVPISHNTLSSTRALLHEPELSLLAIVRNALPAPVSVMMSVEVVELMLSSSNVPDYESWNVGLSLHAGRLIT